MRTFVEITLGADFGATVVVISTASPDVFSFHLPYSYFLYFSEAMTRA